MLEVSPHLLAEKCKKFQITNHGCQEDVQNSTKKTTVVCPSANGAAKLAIGTGTILEASLQAKIL